MLKVARLLGCLMLAFTWLAVGAAPALADGEVSIDLRVTGSGPTDIINVTDFSVPSGNITEDSFTLDRQTAMGALVYYCQENAVNITLADYGGAYVAQIGNDANNLYSWVYAYNETVNWSVSAADQTVGNGDSVHWFNYNFSYYQLLLEISEEKMVQGDNVTATVTWTDGDGTDTPVANADVYVSDDTNAFGYPESPGTDVGQTNADGELSFAWSETGQFWPYAEASDNRTSIEQWPVVSFLCASSNVSLHTGWNFISTPKKLESGFNTVEQVFGEVDTGGHSIWLYDAAADIPWGTGMSSSDEVEPLDGIWIYSTQEDTAYFVFDTYPQQVPPTKTLYAGWNAIGFSDTVSAPANSALTSVEAKWAYLIGFNAGTQESDISIINNTTEGTHDEGRDMEPGKGYWLFMTSDGELAAIGM
jgi:hypothetical protein